MLFYTSNLTVRDIMKIKNLLLTFANIIGIILLISVYLTISYFAAITSIDGGAGVGIVFLGLLIIVPVFGMWDNIKFLSKK